MKNINCAIFTVDWECWDSFRPHPEWQDVSLIEEPTEYLLDLLRRHNIKAIFYIVGWLQSHHPLLFSKIKDDGHVIGDHTYYHSGEKSFEPFRAPRFQGQKRLYSGGFWFRAMPYKWVKREVQKTGTFFIHPHDVMEQHPECGIRTFDRRIGLKNSRDKLEKLVREIKWSNPSEK